MDYLSEIIKEFRFAVDISSDGNAAALALPNTYRSTSGYRIALWRAITLVTFVFFVTFFGTLVATFMPTNGSESPISLGPEVMTHVIANGYANDDDRGMDCNHGCRALIFHSGK